MKKYRYEKIVLEAEEGITFDVSRGTNKEFIIKAKHIVSPNYANPPIPDGYHHLEGEWDDGFVIERYYDGSQFVWIPVGCLDHDGMLDGNRFNLQFGRRNYRKDVFSAEKFHEPMTEELKEQEISVNVYGGFYISRYNISKSLEGKPQSIKDVKPWVWINFNDAKLIAATMENREAVESHLVYGAEYDSVLAWLIKSEAKTLEEITEDSTSWGNHRNTENSPQGVLETGSCETWCVNRIYDLAGNVDEWTQEKYGDSLRVIRGGEANTSGEKYPVDSRAELQTCRLYANTGFRIALCIK